jgi:hypothetical protein
MWKLLAFLIAVQVFITACTIAGIDGAPREALYMPCITLGPDRTDYDSCGCKWEVRLPISDTAKWKNQNTYFAYHLTTGRAFFKLVP